MITPEASTPVKLQSMLFNQMNRTLYEIHSTQNIYKYVCISNRFFENQRNEMQS